MMMRIIPTQYAGAATPSEAMTVSDRSNRLPGFIPASAPNVVPTTITMSSDSAASERVAGSAWASAAVTVCVE